MNEDLKPSLTNRGPMTPDRAFTIAELIIMRVRDNCVRSDEERALLSMAAGLINDVAKAWR